jgi:hypothetical protein
MNHGTMIHDDPWSWSMIGQQNAKTLGQKIDNKNNAQYNWFCVWEINLLKEI